VVSLRPNLTGQRTKKARRREEYDTSKLAEAGRLYLECADQLGGVDTYRFDLVNVMRQVMANLVQDDFEEIVGAYEAKDRKRLAAAGEHMFGLIRDMDKLLGTRREFMVGPWLADARRWARNDQERRLYEWNARNQITLWGPRDSWLHDYARKDWSGMMASFPLPRWELFVRRLDEALAGGKECDVDAFEKEVRLLEEKWAQGMEDYPVAPVGDSVAVVRELWDKYGSLALASQATSKP
jgi:alpha-N-acetylglucosaminidase